MDRFDYGVGEDRILREVGKSGAMLISALIGEEAEKESGDEMRNAKDEIYFDLVGRSELRLTAGANGVMAAVHARGLKTAIATSSALDGLRKSAEAAGLDLSTVDELITDDDVEVGKPHPDVVEAAVAKLGLSPAECVLVGDTPFDVKSAQRAGVLCLGVETGVYGCAELRRSGARAVYRDVSVLAERLDEAIAAASPGGIHLTDEVMKGLVRLALEEARKALGSGDLPVGAVLADGEGKILSRAHSLTESRRNFLMHGEMLVLEQAIEAVSADRRGLILVSTLEPCIMCFGAAMGARIDTIIFSLPAASNSGIARCEPMQSPGMIMPRVIGGILQEESLVLFREWNRQHPGSAYVEELLVDSG